MKLAIFISCMHQKDTSIIDRLNVRTYAVVVNKYNKNNIQNLDFTCPNDRIHRTLFIGHSFLEAMKK